MMLFHVLNLCSVCYTESMTLPRLSPVVVIQSYWELSEHPALQGVSWGWFLTLVHIFHPFLCFEEKTVGGN